MAYSTLNAIRIKVRRLTRSQSTLQINDAEIDEYINTFILYDMPSILNLSFLRKTFSFYTQPNVDTYTTITSNVGEPMYNFKNAIITSSDPIYISGYKSWFTQSQEEFFNRYPIVKEIKQINTADGLTNTFAGIFTGIPVLPRNILITSTFTNKRSFGLVAIPLVDAFGVQLKVANFYSTDGPIPTTDPTIVIPLNTIDLLTGAYTISFIGVPEAGTPINAQTVQFTPSRPNSVLFFDNTFTLRPVPDQQYDVKIECYTRPTELLDNNQSPDLEQWWQYIAYGAAMKILQDRTDIESASALMPEFLNQQKLVQRRTIQQQGDQRASSIYSDQSGLGGSSRWCN